MTSGSEDGPEPGEPNFADVMNAFSFDSGRSSKRRRRGRRRAADAASSAEADQQAAEPTAGAVPGVRTGQPGAPPPMASGLVQFTPPPGVEAASGSVDLPAVAEPEEPATTESAAAVRPYAWTRGRTKSGFDLAIETLLSTSRRGHEQLGTLPVEHRVVAQLCEQTRSVAEVAALLAVPLGVARVLLGDMAGLGLVMVHETVSSVGHAPDLALMERVLSGLRRL